MPFSPSVDSPDSPSGHSNSVSPFIGSYFVKGLISAEASNRNLTLTLSQDGSAALTTEYVGQGTLIERGHWNAEHSRADILWTDLDGKPIRLQMIFELRGNTLVYIGPDPNAFGVNDVTLDRMAHITQ